MNVFEAIEQCRVPTTRFEQSHRAHLMARAVTAVQWSAGQPDQDAAEQLFAVLRFIRSFMGIELAGYCDGATFAGIDVNSGGDFGRILSEAQAYLDRKEV